MASTNDALLTNVRLPDGGGPIDITIEAGQIGAIAAHAPGARADASPAPVPTFDGGGRVVLPRFVDAHMHLDKTLMGERWIGLPETRTLAERVAVPRRNLLPKPEELSFAEAACLPTAWLTAYRMLFVRSGLRPGQTVLVQGASGGVATALIALGRAGGFRMWVTGRSEDKRAAALELGADQAFETGARLPERVDGVMETVGEATWSHSVKSLKPGGVIVTSGATTGFNPGAELNRVFFTQLSVIGSTMGTRDELADLIAQMNEQMLSAARELQFEVAARLRDELAELKKELRQFDAAHA